MQKRITQTLFQAEEGKESSSDGNGTAAANGTSAEDEGGVSDEILGDALVVGAQVIVCFDKLFSNVCKF